MKHLLERGVIVIHILGEPLLGEPLFGHGLLIELDVHLCEEVVNGRRNCLRMMNERRKVKMMKKVKGVRENAQLMHAWWWPWDGMRRTRKHLEPMCDVQEMSVTTQNWLRRLQHYAHAHVFMLCFVLILWILVFTSSLVSDASTSSKMVFRQLHFTTHTQHQVQNSSF